MKRTAFCLVLLLSLVALACNAGASGPGTSPQSSASPGAKPANPDLILATTTSTQDSGLLDVLIPRFEQQTGYRVKTIAVGSGQAMTMGERGEADVLLVHAPDSEKKFMDAGHGVNRRLVMHNDFVIVGPASDPAAIKGITVAREALQKIADARAPFISRGDNSGTHQLEKSLWATSPEGQSWYLESGQGMGQTLNIASEKSAYTVTDRGTYLAFQKNLHLDILVQGDRSLLNIYHVIEVDPAKSDKINADGARAFADFIVSKDVQDTIEEFGVDRFGQPLFFPDAGKSDDQVGQ